MKAFVKAAIGFAAGCAGNGVAYARIGQGARAQTLRVAFQIKRYPALLEREVGYAALTSVAAALLRRGIGSVELSVSDGRLFEDLSERHELPPALTLAYVRLRCVLNQFKEYRMRPASSSDSDLAARARGEVEMHAAA